MKLKLYLFATALGMVCTLLTDCVLAEQTMQSRLIVVVGAGGESKYTDQFETWAGRWMAAVKDTGFDTVLIHHEKEGKSALEQLREQLKPDQGGETESSATWLILIGHGTFDGTHSKFNLVGPDIAAKELDELLRGLASNCIIVNCASASGPFINELSGANRIVVTATKSGYEYNFARFGSFLSQVVSESVADSTKFDLDKDGQTSLLELTLAASRQTTEFYETDKRLATEHALIEDNRDGLGTPTEWFRGVRSIKRAKSGNAPDGLRANQVFLTYNKNVPTLSPEKLAERDDLEKQLEALRLRKSSYSEDDYYTELESILLELAELYRDH